MLLFLFIIVFLGYCYLPLADKLIKRSRLLEDIKAEIADLEESNLFLESEKKRLDSDLDYIDRLVREKLDLIRPGEVLYKIVDQKSRGGAVR